MLTHAGDKPHKSEETRAYSQGQEDEQLRITKHRSDGFLRLSEKNKFYIFV